MGQIEDEDVNVVNNGGVLMRAVRYDRLIPENAIDDHAILLGCGMLDFETCPFR